MPDGKHINYTTVFGKNSYYFVYSVDPDPKITKNSKGETVCQRDAICKIPRDHPSYMHSFAGYTALLSISSSSIHVILIPVTENYVILVEFPWRFSLSAMLQQGFMEFITGRKGKDGPLGMFKWQPDVGKNSNILVS